jgi:hypothetical protein
MGWSSYLLDGFVGMVHLGPGRFVTLISCSHIDTESCLKRRHAITPTTLDASLPTYPHSYGHLSRPTCPFFAVRFLARELVLPDF